MYCEHFGLREKPFLLAADPRYLYMSAQHWEAMAHLMYGVSDDWGFVLVTGEIGTGKTTLCRLLLDQMPPDVDAAFLMHPKLTVPELLASVCDEFRIPLPTGAPGLKGLIDLLTRHLLEIHAGARKALLIIDEAQDLSDEALEQLRLLTNLETAECKLLRIILLGQPELRERLARPGLAQMSQRITARYHLGPLPRKDAAACIEHRLSVAGGSIGIFSQSARRKLFQLSRGIPRLINVIADRALLGACLKKETVVSRRTVIEAGREVLDSGLKRWTLDIPVSAGWAIAGLALLLAIVLVLAGPGALTRQNSDGRQMTAAAMAPAAANNNAGMLTWPEGRTEEESRADAYAALAAGRGFSYFTSGKVTESSFCSNMELLDLRCAHANMKRRSLTAVPRPAVLELSLPDGSLLYAALLNQENGTATIRDQGRDLQVSADRLQGLWSGRIMTLEPAVPSGWSASVPAGPRNNRRIQK